MAKAQFFADVDNITNKRGTNEIVVKLITQEISDSEAGVIMSLRNKYVGVLLSTNEITAKEAEELPDEFAVAPVLDGKSPSQRLRNTLYVLWESRYKSRYPEFNSYYDKAMELIIEEYKDKI